MRRARRRGVAVIAGVALALGLMVAPAGAAIKTYPAGGSSFSGGPEGWKVSAASCNVAVLCTPSGGYDEGQGNPAGSLSADTTVLLNLLSLFQSTVTLQSPDFVVTEAGTTTLHLDRQFEPGGLLNLGPQVTYSARLIDKTTGTESTPVSGTLAGATGWGGADGAASVKAGHVYALAIDAVTSSTLVNLAVAGSSSARFDNVELAVNSSASGGGGGAGGGGGGAGAGQGAGAGGAALSKSQLRRMVRNSLVRRAVVRRGKRILVKVRCPKRIGRACHVGLRGYLGRRAVTTARNFRVGSGKTKRIPVWIKKRFRKQVAKRKKLRFREVVRVGKMRVVLHPRARLIRR